jgi:hypothetical protein
MILVKFRNTAEHSNVLNKIKHMKKFMNELEECLEDVIEQEDLDFRDTRRHMDYEDEDEMYASRSGGRYGYRGGRSRM